MNINSLELMQDKYWQYKPYLLVVEKWMSTIITLREETLKDLTCNTRLLQVIVLQNRSSPCSNKWMSVSSVRSGAHKHCIALISQLKVFLCLSDDQPVMQSSLLLLAACSLLPKSPQVWCYIQKSGQAIFVDLHSCNSHLSQMIDRMGFVTAQFPVIVLPVSAEEKLQDKPLIQYLQYLTYFYRSGPSLSDRKTFGQFGGGRSACSVLCTRFIIILMLLLH